MEINKYSNVFPMFFILIVLLFQSTATGIIIPTQRDEIIELSYSTYLGGNNIDEGKFIEIDPLGNIIVAGITFSTNFPTTENAYSKFSDGSTAESDLFVVKFDSTGRQVIFSTYISGNNNDVLTGMKIDSEGNIVLIGYTYSNYFPLTDNAINDTWDGDRFISDIFVTKLASNGSSLIFSTYIAGSSNDIANDVALDSMGNIIITGYTSSEDYPVTDDSYDVLGDGISHRSEVIVTKISPNGSSILSSTFVTGSDSDYGQRIAVDSEDNIIIAGYTYSNDFPITNDSYQHTSTYEYNYVDLFIFKLDNTLSNLLSSSRIAGDREEKINTLILDKWDNPIFGGYSYSDNYPVTLGAINSSSDGSPYRTDIFVSQLSSNWTNLLYSSYITGNDYDEVFGLEIGSDNNLYMTGFTKSTDFPTTQDAMNRTGDEVLTSSDMFMLKLNLTSEKLIYSSYLGGDHLDIGGDIILDSNNSILITGKSWSDNFPSTDDAIQNTKTWAYDVTLSIFKQYREDITESPSDTVSITDTTINSTPDPVITSETNEDPVNFIGQSAISSFMLITTIMMLRKRKKK